MLNEKEARALTDSIKSNTTGYANLIYQAWQGKAWVPLGYDSFSAYLQQEVGISRARGYQLINLAVMEERLTALATFPDDFTISDYATRLIIKHGVDDFLTTLKPSLTDNTGGNEEAFLTLLQQIRTGSPVTAPTASVGQDIGYAAEAAAQAFRIHCLHLPTPDVVDDPKVLPVVRGKLRDAVRAAEARLNEYAEVLANGAQEAV